MLIEAKLTKKIKRTPTIESFRFSLAKSFSFLPGQFVRLIFDKDNLDNAKLNKYLSLSSSPTKNYIQLTKRLSGSDFSGALRSLKVGDRVNLQGPMGDCVFRPSYKKISFLIGGIGITPVISIIGYIAETDIDSEVSLIYSNRTPAEIAFKGVLDNWGQKDNIKIIHTITDTEVKSDCCLHGKIDKEMVQRHVADLRETVFFLFGPPAMVKAMTEICASCGVEKKKLKSENFIGY